MAVSGGMTTAYKCKMCDGALHVDRTTYPRNRCADVDAALTAMADGETVIVASADIPALRARLHAQTTK